MLTLKIIPGHAHAPMFRETTSGTVLCAKVRVGILLELDHMTQVCYLTGGLCSIRAKATGPLNGGSLYGYTRVALNHPLYVINQFINHSTVRTPTSINNLEIPGL